MTPERWQKIKELYEVVAECEAHRREEVLSELCRDDHDLKREIQTLLAQATQDEGVLEEPVWRKLGIEQAQPDIWMPATIGRYRVLGLVGAGGMGAVYEAEQDHPRRTVALKVIKPGLANPELLRRFERESQALARLQHPGIAQIYDAGTADTAFGRQPYFAMEFVRGETLREYSSAHRLQIRQRLELMARICDAVEHAHQRGLIHRDLKPGNILVDAAGQPKILDFGVARLTGSEIQATRQTDVGQLVGTLAYMSPEQVLADPLELDTRSDVYAIGVILYELLAERLPYTINTRLHEAVQTIREEDPIRLSSVSRAYRGDIEIIVAKALEKEKSRRYASAAALAEDIHRYLNDQPITARSASAAYQMQKFARRHKALVSAVAAVFVVLVGGILVSTWQALRAREAERKAVAAEREVIKERDAVTLERNRALEARQQAQQERNQALAEKQRADNESRIAQEVSAFLQKDLLAQASANAQSRPDNKPDPDLKVRTVLDRAAARINDRFLDQPLVEGSIRQTIGTAYKELGLFAEGRQLLQRAYDLRKKTLGENHPDTLASLFPLADSYLQESKYPEAEDLLSRMLQGLRRFRSAEHPDVLSAESELALVYQYQGKYAKAEAMLVHVLAVQRRVVGLEHPDTVTNIANIALIYLSQGKHQQAEESYREAVALKTKLQGPEHPSTLRAMNGLGLALNGVGKRTEAESIFRDALEKERRILGAEHPDTLVAMNNLGSLYMGQGRFREAEPLYADALAAKRRTLGEENPDTLTTMNNLGALYSDESRFADAEPLLTKVMEARKRILGPEHPNTFNVMTNVAQLYYRQGRLKESETLLDQILAGRQKVLGKEHPSTWVTLNHIGVVYSRQGRLKEAESLLLPLIENWRGRFGDAHLETLRTIDNLATVYLLQGDFAQAQTLFTKALEGRRRALGDNSPDVLRTASNLAAAQEGLGARGQAESLLAATLKTQRALLGDDHLDTLATIERLADHYRRAGESAQAQALLDEASRVRRRILGAN